MTKLKTYKNRKGETLFKASLEDLEEMDDDEQGLCLACGDVNDIEPDAYRCECPSCGAMKLYGATELILRGIYY